MFRSGKSRSKITSRTKTKRKKSQLLPSVVPVANIRETLRISDPTERKYNMQAITDFVEDDEWQKLQERSLLRKLKEDGIFMRAPLRTRRTIRKLSKYLPEKEHAVPIKKYLKNISKKISGHMKDRLTKEKQIELLNTLTEYIPQLPRLPRTNEEKREILTMLNTTLKNTQKDQQVWGITKITENPLEILLDELDGNKDELDMLLENLSAREGSQEMVLYKIKNEPYYVESILEEIKGGDMMMERRGGTRQRKPTRRKRKKNRKNRSKKLR
jgi:hypothetical protein